MAWKKKSHKQGRIEWGIYGATNGQALIEQLNALSRDGVFVHTIIADPLEPTIYQIICYTKQFGQNDRVVTEDSTL